MQEYEEMKISKEEKGRTRFWTGYTAGFITVLAVLFLIFFVIQFPFSGGLSIYENIAALTKLNNLNSYLREEYLEELDAEDLLEGAYAGFMSAVGDPYTRYYTKEQYQDYLEDLEGSYAGIGVSVQWNAETGMLHILSVTEGGPGDKAGLQVDDEIYMVDETKVQGMESADVIQMIKGEEGTTVLISVIRDNSTEPVEINVTRERIVEQTVEYQMIDKEIGYIALSSFDEITVDQFAEALKALQTDGMQGMIIDLRDNPGGRLSTVTEIADTLLPEGIITYTETKKGERREYTSDADCVDIPIVVLINKNSASASEILAGAVQDMNAGKLVGVTTYGKGIVQNTIPLKDGSAIKLTMARYYTPSGRYIHGVGIAPDIVIDLPGGVSLSDVRLTEKDIQFETAVEAMKTLLNP